MANMSKRALEAVNVGRLVIQQGSRGLVSELRDKHDIAEAAELVGDSLSRLVDLERPLTWSVSPSELAENAVANWVRDSLDPAEAELVLSELGDEVGKRESNRRLVAADEIDDHTERAAGEVTAGLERLSWADDDGSLVLNASAFVDHAVAILDGSVVDGVLYADVQRWLVAVAHVEHMLARQADPAVRPEYRQAVAHVLADEVAMAVRPDLAALSEDFVADGRQERDVVRAVLAEPEVTRRPGVARALTMPDSVIKDQNPKLSHFAGVITGARPA